MQHGNVGASPYRSAPETPQCEVLFELFHGDAGTVQLGRLLRGHDAGRIVTLRALESEPSAELASAVDVSRSIAHPRLAKVLGIVRDRDTWYLASEFVSGVTLFELGQTMLRRGAELSAAVAARIVLDALKAASEAQRLLLATAHLERVRCLFPECIWVTEYGGVLLSDVLIAPLLLASAGAPASQSPERAEAADVGAAAAALMQLVGAQSGADVTLPAELRQVLAVATRSDGAAGFATVEEFIAALSSLENALIASEEEVGVETLRVSGVTSEWRRQRLEMLQGGAGHSEPTEAEATRVFRVVARHGPAEDTRVLEEATVVFSNVSATDPTSTERLSQPNTPEKTNSNSNDSNATISAVWREARAVMGSPRRKTRPANIAAPIEPAATIEPEIAALTIERARGVGVTKRSVVLALVAAVVACTLTYSLYKMTGNFANF